jgi:uncharacterized membrane protein (UPF0136 family)
MISIATLLFCYGLFLIICGIVSVIFIGLKAKTALVSGGLSGVMAVVISYLTTTPSSFAPILGMVLTLLLFGVFAWRCTKTLFKVLELTATQHTDVKGKAIAFLIISLMAVVSLVVSLLQVVVYFA